MFQSIAQLSISFQSINWPGWLGASRRGGGMGEEEEEAKVEEEEAVVEVR